MSTIMEKLDQEHGTNYWVMLDSLGGHPHRDYQQISGSAGQRQLRGRHVCYAG